MDKLILDSVITNFDLVFQAFLITFAITGFALVLLTVLWVELRAVRKIAEALAKKNGLTLVE